MTEKKKKLLSALLSLSIAASPFALTGCSQEQSETISSSVTSDVTNEFNYLMEINDNNVIIYEVDLVNDWQTNYYRIYTKNRELRTIGKDRSIVLRNKEEAEFYFNMFNGREDINVVWISDSQKEKTR